MLDFKIRKQHLTFRNGLRRWDVLEEPFRCTTAETALIIVDMWDKHWSSGSTRRFGQLAPRINESAGRARERGILVVHAPSDTETFYRGSPARDRLFSAPRLAAIPEPVTVNDHPLPIDDSDGGSESVDDYPPHSRVWTRQNEVIMIDQARDVLCGDEGDLLFSYLQYRGIRFLIYTGVASNMCVLNRSFGIKKMLRRGMRTVLVRDLTDAMYNPERPPYVSHEEGAALVTAYIEKFYCPTIDSGQV
ncbi:MAG: isochorismatase family protein [Treponema sp.]|nr:isochorismatase family protein [Treponema sp.]